MARRRHAATSGPWSVARSPSRRARRPARSTSTSRSASRSSRLPGWGPPGRRIGRSHRGAPVRRGDRRATRARARRRRGAGRPSGLGLAGAHRRRPAGRPGPARGARPTRRRDRLPDRRGSTLRRPLGPHDRSHVLAHADHLVRTGPWRDAHLPDLVVRFGATTTSKPMLTLLDRRATRPGRRRRRSRLERSGDPADDVRARRCDHHRDGAGGCSRGERPCAGDATGRATGARRTGPLTAPSWSGWRPWRRATSRSRGCPSSPSADVLPDGALLWAGNSMPVRDHGRLAPEHGPRHPAAVEPRRQRHRRGRLDRARRGGGRRRTGRARRRRRVVPARPQRARGRAAPRPVRDDRARRQRRRRDLLVPAAGDDRCARGGPARPLRGAVRDAPRDRRRADRHGPRRRVPDGRSGHDPGCPGRLRSARPGVQVLAFRTDRARNVELHREAAAAVAAAVSPR